MKRKVIQWSNFCLKFQESLVKPKVASPMVSLQGKKYIYDKKVYVMCFYNTNFEFHEDFSPKYVTKIQIWKRFGLNLYDCQVDMGMTILKLKRILQLTVASCSCI